MSLKKYQTRCYGKWILAGEHTVLRGGTALVFPLRSRYLNLNFELNNTNDLQIHLEGQHGHELRLLVWNVLDRATEILKIDKTKLKGSLKMSNSIPVGGGLGASAALSVAISRMFSDLNYLTNQEICEFARQLENLFHGESSGVDVAVVQRETALKFTRGQALKEWQTSWQPFIYLSYSGERGVTRDCVSMVKKIFDESPTKARQIDEQMSTAVNDIEYSFSTQNLDLLKSGMAMAADCFDKWKLVSPNLQEQMRRMQELGALVSKPTGSGGGGYVISLFAEKLDEKTVHNLNLIPCFAHDI